MISQLYHPRYDRSAAAVMLLTNHEASSAHRPFLLRVLGIEAPWELPSTINALMHYDHALWVFWSSSQGTTVLDDHAREALIARCAPAAAPSRLRRIMTAIITGAHQAWIKIIPHMGKEALLDIARGICASGNPVGDERVMHAIMSEMKAYGRRLASPWFLRRIDDTNINEARSVLGANETLRRIACQQSWECIPPETIEHMVDEAASDHVWFQTEKWIVRVWSRIPESARRAIQRKLLFHIEQERLDDITVGKWATVMPLTYASPLEQKVRHRPYALSACFACIPHAHFEQLDERIKHAWFDAAHRSSIAASWAVRLFGPLPSLNRVFASDDKSSFSAIIAYAGNPLQAQTSPANRYWHLLWYVQNIIESIEDDVDQRHMLIPREEIDLRVHPLFSDAATFFSLSHGSLQPSMVGHEEPSKG